MTASTEKKQRDSTCIVISCVDKREEAIRKEWTSRVQENDHIVAIGYAERQIQNTLKLVEPIDVNMRGGGDVKSERELD